MLFRSYQVSVSRQVPLSVVQFPFGQIALSGMWLAHSPDPSVDLAEAGDSGSLFVFVGQDRLYPAALAVAVSAEYRVWDHESRTLGKDCGPAVLLCPVESIVGEITKLKIRFCKCATHPPVAMASQAGAA